MINMPNFGNLEPNAILINKQCLFVTAEYHIVIAQRLALRTAKAIGLKQNACYHVATAITELTSNILRHAGSGEVCVFEIKCGVKRGIEILAADEGPGINDLSLAMSDGFSTIGGLGSGLPGVKRLMDEIWIDSTPKIGTKAIARKWLT